MCFLTPARNEESECLPGVHGSSRTREGQTPRPAPHWLEDAYAPWPQRVFCTRARVGRTPGPGQRTGEGPGERQGQERVVNREPGRGFHGRRLPSEGWPGPSAQQRAAAAGGGKSSRPCSPPRTSWPLLAPGPPCPGQTGGQGPGPARRSHQDLPGPPRPVPAPTAAPTSPGWVGTRDSFKNISFAK